MVSEGDSEEMVSEGENEEAVSEEREIKKFVLTTFYRPESFIHTTFP